MKRSHYFAVVLSTLTVWSVVTGGAASNSEQFSRPTSLVDLIVRPQELENRRIMVSGFLSRDANLYLYLTEDHAKLEDIASAVLVDSDGLVGLAANHCLERYVSAVGSFGKDAGGEYAILQLDEVLISSEAWGKRSCWARQKGRK
jgi:hypothetical protein